MDKTNNIILRDYQEKALEALANNPIGLVSAATGSGKTTMISQHILREHSGKTLILVHLIDLAKQTAARMKEETGLKVVEYHSAKRESFNRAKIVVSTWQSMAKLIEAGEVRKNSFNHIIVDECHHIASDKYSNVVSFFNSKTLHGFTATPYGSGQDNILSTFNNNIIFEIGLFELIEQGYLSPLQIFIHTDDVKGTQYNESYHVSKFKEINKLCNRNTKAIHFFSKNRLIDNVRLFNLIDHKNYSEITSRISNKKRERILNDFRIKGSNTKHILSNRILNEGIDLPITNTLIFHENVGGFRTFSQRLGRGLRVYGTKQITTKVAMFLDIKSMDSMEAVDNFIREVEQSRKVFLKTRKNVNTRKFVTITLSDQTKSFLRDYRIHQANLASSHEINHVCPTCGKPMHITPKSLLYVAAGGTINCSECAAKKTENNHTCDTCGKPIHVSPRRLKMIKAGGICNCKECAAEKTKASKVINYTCSKCGKPMRITEKKLASGLKYLCSECAAEKAKANKVINHHCSTCGKPMHVSPSTLKYIATGRNINCQECKDKKRAAKK